MVRSAFWLGLLGILVAPAAWAVPAQTAAWAKNCQSNATTRTVTPGTVACYRSTGAGLEAASPVLDATNCENVDIFMFDDPTGAAGAICTAVYEIQMCPPGAGELATDALKNAACFQLPGTTDLSADDVESNLAAQYLRVIGTAVGANPTSCQIVVKCAAPGQP